MNPAVNGLWLVVAAACNYVLAYRFYSCWLAKELGDAGYLSRLPTKVGEYLFSGNSRKPF